MHSDDYTERERQKEYEFLKTHIFNSLINLNDGFDSETIFYFSAEDFEIVLNRVEAKGLMIYGIKPWLNSEFCDVLVYEDYNTEASDPVWYRNAFEVFKNRQKGLLYSASYAVPYKLLSI